MRLSFRKMNSIYCTYVLSLFLFFVFAISAISEISYIAFIGVTIFFLYVLFSNFKNVSILLVILTPNGMIFFIPGINIRIIGFFYMLALLIYILKKRVKGNFNYIIPLIGIISISICRLIIDKNFHDILLIIEIFSVIYFWVIILNKKDKLFDRRLYRAFLYGVLLMTFGMFLNKAIYGGDRMMALFDDSNYTSVVFALLFACSTFSIFNKKKILYNMILLFFSLIMGFLTGSRAFILSSGLIVFLYFVMSFKFRQARKIAFSYLLLFGIIIVLYLLRIPSVVKLYDVIINRTLSLLNNHHSGEFMDATSGRVFLWKYYLNQLSSSTTSIFFGNGFSTYYLVENGGYGLVAHNSFVSGLMGFGIVGTFLIVFTYAYFLKKYFFKKAKANERIISITLLVPILVGYFFLDGLLDIRLLLYFSICIIVKRMNHDEYIIEGQKSVKTFYPYNSELIYN